MKGKTRGIILTVITLMAAYLVFASIGMVDLPEWDSSWWPVQFCMFIVGMAWIILFEAANGAFDEDEDEEDEKWDI